MTILTESACIFLNVDCLLINSNSFGKFSEKSIEDEIIYEPMRNARANGRVGVCMWGSDIVEIFIRDIQPNGIKTRARSSLPSSRRSSPRGSVKNTRQYLKETNACELAISGHWAGPGRNKLKSRTAQGSGAFVPLDLPINGSGGRLLFNWRTSRRLHVSRNVWRFLLGPQPLTDDWQGIYIPLVTVIKPHTESICNE